MSVSKSIVYTIALLLISLNIGQAQTYDSSDDIYDRYRILSSTQEKYNFLQGVLENKDFQIDAQFAFLLNDVVNLKLAEKDSLAAIDLLNPLLNYYYNRGSQPDSLLNMYMRVEPFVQMHKSSKAAEVIVNAANGYYAINNLKESYDLYIIAAEKYREIADTINPMYGRSYLYAADNANEMGQMGEAILNFKKAEDIFKTNSDTTNFLWAAYGQLALLSKLGFYDEAEAKQKSLLEIAQSANVQEIIFAIQTTVVANGIKNKKDKEVRDAALTMVQICSDFNLFNFCYEAYLSATSAYLNLGIIDSAQLFFDMFTEISESFKANSVLNSNYKILAAELAMAKGDVFEAQQILDETLSSNTHIQQISFKVNALNIQYAIDTTLKDYKSAFFHLNELKTLTDSLNKEMLKNQFLYYQTMFESNEKDQRIFKQDARIAEISLKASTERFLWSAGLITILTLGILFYFLYREFQSKKNRQLREEYNKDILSAQENERKMIAGSLTKNIEANLLTIKDQLKSESKDSNEILVNNALEEVRRISRNLHPFLLQNLGLTAAIKQMADEIELKGDIIVDYSVEEAIDDLLPYEYNLNLYRIIQEAVFLVANYSKTDVIKMLLYKNGSNLILELIAYHEDLIREYNNRTSDLLELKKIKERVKIFNGKMKILPESDVGLKINIQVPYKSVQA